MRREVETGAPVLARVKPGNLQLVVSGDGSGRRFGRQRCRALAAVARSRRPDSAPSASLPRDLRRDFDPPRGCTGSSIELVAHHAGAGPRVADRRARQFWAKADASSPEQWQESTQSIATTSGTK